MHKIISGLNRRLSSFFILLASLFAGSVYAEIENDNFYINAVYVFNTTADIYTDNPDFSDSGGFAGFMGYDILSWLSIEAGGIVLNSMNATQTTDSFERKTKYEISGYTIGLKGITSFANLFDIWVGMGLYSWKSKFDYEIEYPGFPPDRQLVSNTNSSEDAYFRLGITLPLTYDLSATLESSYMELDDLFYEANGEDIDFDHRYIGLGLEYRF